MKTIRSTLSLLVVVSLGTVVASCNSFSSGGGSGTGGSTSPGAGGSDSSGSGGDNITGSGGDSTTGSGGDNTTGSGGDSSSGSGGSVVTGSGGSSSGSGGSSSLGSGGSSSAGAGGSSPAGGGGSSSTGRGGTTGAGGAAGTGTGRGGTTGAGGAAGTGTGRGGTTGTGGAAGSGRGGTTGTGGGAAGTGGSTPITTVCDILSGGGNNCVAAHSTVRVLYPSYTGPLYQVCKGTSKAGPASCSGTTMDIGSISGGYANGPAQDTFCSGGTCTISIIYDQTPNHNDLKPGPGGGAKTTPDNPASATALKTSLNGHEVYGVLIQSGMGYRAGCTSCGVVTPKGTATGDQAETEYMVTSQNNLVDSCCFDYGNAETDAHDDGNGTMEAVYFGGGVVWGTGSPGGHNNGPWVMADLENGLYAGWQNNQDQNISTNTPTKYNYVTAILVGDTQDKNSGQGRFALYAADATTTTLQTKYDGIRPAKTGYVPMHKQGSIILGIGGDNSDSGGGEWFEGVMASGAATTGTLNSLQGNIAAAGYGK